MAAAPSSCATMESVLMGACVMAQETVQMGVMKHHVAQVGKVYLATIFPS